MSAPTVFEVEGVVLENLPNTSFRVKVTSSLPDNLTDKILLCHLAGRMRRNWVRLLPGDKVRLQINSLDMSKGRVIYRLK